MFLLSNFLAFDSFYILHLDGLFFGCVPESPENSPVARVVGGTSMVLSEQIREEYNLPVELMNTTYDHIHEKVRDPVRSPLVKLVRAELVLRSVTTGESSVLYVFFSAFIPTKSPSRTQVIGPLARRARNQLYTLTIIC